MRTYKAAMGASEEDEGEDIAFCFYDKSGTMLHSNRVKSTLDTIHSSFSTPNKYMISI